MDKIICDVCGTSYPESSGQCPICGYVKPSKVTTASSDAPYVPVKGGRFSASNVKRKSEGSALPAKDVQRTKVNRRPGGNSALGITVIVLLLVLIVVLVFFIVKVLNDRSKTGGDTQTQPVQTESVLPSADSNGESLTIHSNSQLIEFKEAGEKFIIHTYTVPENETDSVTYASMDPGIASVDASGTVTAVAPGQTSVVVRCKDAMLIVTVHCNFGDADAKWGLNRKDITFSKKGETWDLYSKTSTVPKNQITWTSDDESVAKIADGIVEAVGSGVTKVHGSYYGTKVSCTIRCKLPEDADTQTPEPTEPDTEQDPDTLKLWPRNDVTLSVNESFELQLRDSSGKAMDVEWTASSAGYVLINGNKITGLKSTKGITVSATYGGKTFECIIRVR